MSSYLKKYVGEYMFEHWLNNHQKLGGFLASSYVDWELLHSPLHDIIHKLEEFRQVPFDAVMEFSDAGITDNSMEYRDIVEDVSKIFYLCEMINYNELIYHPQIIHEPWYKRYRVHPGSGRLMALWLCGYEKIKTIYIHFDEPGFQPPGDCFIIKDRKTAQKEFHVNQSLAKKLEIETYAAFPKTKVERIRTKAQDHEWEWNHIHTDKFWQFMRFSEGSSFLEHKNMWRSYAIDAWQDLQQDHIQIGTTVFDFDHTGKVIQVHRNTGSETVDTIIHK